MNRAGLIVGATILTILAGVVMWSRDAAPLDFHLEHFDAFNRRYNRRYASMADRAFRFEIFKANYDKIVAHNQKNLSYTLAVNKFADMTFEEFKSFYATDLQRFPSAKDECQEPPTPKSAPFPDKVDWNAAGKVQKPKDQQRKRCAASYAFTAIAATESAIAIKTGQPVLDLSEQELIDCSMEFGNRGCNGGVMHWALNYILQNNISESKDYPYQAKLGDCKTQALGGAKVGISRCVRVVPNQIGLKSAVVLSPVAAGFALEESFIFYEGGVYFPLNCFGSPNFYVLIYGYDESQPKSLEYFMGKTSLGTDWGMKGHFKIYKSRDPKGLGICSLEDNGLNYYPVA